MKSVGRIWRSWHRIDGGGVNSLRPYASLRVPQELIDWPVEGTHLGRERERERHLPEGGYCQLSNRLLAGLRGLRLPSTCPSVLLIIVYNSWMTVK